MSPPATRHRVSVGLGARGYDILIGDGLVEAAGREIAALAPNAACFVVTDDHVGPLYLDRLVAGLAAAGLRHASATVPAGEATKCVARFAQLCDAVLAARMERGDLVVALGGGVVGDLAGYVAASVRRGMRLVQVPTSLLAQVDSSVGGKTGVNSAHGKNLIGAFHQPSLVLADTACLDTLPPREFRAGYAEVVKYGLIADLALFEWLEATRAALYAGGPARGEAVARCCAAKALVVSRDETETGERALLNFGHTFGHALERLSDYDGARLVHGEGVAIGMACATRLSVDLGLCERQDAVRVERHLEAAGLPTRIRQVAGWVHGVEAVVDAMGQDKKVKRGALTLILTHGIGRAFIAEGVPRDTVRDFLARELSEI